MKEEVLSGTEAFCRCCREGLNGKFCGYQSYSSTQKLTRKGMPHVAKSNSAAVLDLLIE